MAALCDRYLAEHVDIHNKPRTRAENRRMVERIIKPKLGHLKVEAVDHEDVARLHRELKRTPRQANHVVAVLSKMFHLAERWKLRPLNSNPCKHIRRYPENARDRYPLPEELERIGIAMREMETEGKLRSEDAACVRFLALVGCRLSEAVDLELEQRQLQDRRLDTARRQGWQARRDAGRAGARAAGQPGPNHRPRIRSAER